MKRISRLISSVFSAMDHSPSSPSPLSEESRSHVELVLNKLGWTPMLMIIVLSLMVLISFLLGYEHGHLSIYFPFISETGGLAPEMCTFSLGLCFGGAIGAVVVFFRYLVMSYYFRGAKKLELANHLSCLFGVISMVGLVLVGAFPVTIILWMHLIATGIHFGFGFLYICMQTFFTHKMPEEDKVPWLCKLRLAANILVFVTLVPLAIMFPVGYFDWAKQHKKSIALKVPGDKLFGIVFATSFLEWFMYSSFLFYFFTLIFELRNFRLAIRVEDTTRITRK